jgi:23S rRNA pseudouridine1911/1915/1917 synthase
LIHYDKNSLSTIGDKLRPGIVHRIDKNTSGLVVIAKNNETHKNLSKQFSDHTITRIYQLLIWGKLRPSSGRIDSFITRSSRNRQLMEVSRSKGKQAITNYKTIEIFENNKTPTLSLVECKLETGRTHQIRVHMNYLGNSIVGDDKYKKKYKKLKNIDIELENSIYKLNRQFLHAKTLGFIHPKTNKKKTFSSILPKELNNLLKMLRNTDE